MALDFNKLKQEYLARREEKQAAQEERMASEPKKQSALGKKLAPFKQGLADIKAVSEEGNIKLFIKQLAVIALAAWGVWTVMGKLNAQKAEIQDRITAIALQQTHQDDYMSNKDRLLRLEPLFPDMGQKNEWLVKTLMTAFGNHDIKGDINGNAVENMETNYTIVTQDVTFREKFANIGRFLADIENGNDFLRVSNLTITKLADTNSLGQNNVSLRFNTVFPKDKYGKRLFKDYDKQIKAIEAENEAAVKAAEAAEKAAAAGGKANAS